MVRHLTAQASPKCALFVCLYYFFFSSLLPPPLSTRFPFFSRARREEVEFPRPPFSRVSRLRSCYFARLSSVSPPTNTSNVVEVGFPSFTRYNMRVFFFSSFRSLRVSREGRKGRALGVAHNDACLALLSAAGVVARVYERLQCARVHAACK